MMQTRIKHAVAPAYPMILYDPVKVLPILNSQGPIALPATRIDMANPLIAPRCFLPKSFGHVTTLSILNIPLAIPYETNSAVFPNLVPKIARDAEAVSIATPKARNIALIGSRSLAQLPINCAATEMNEMGRNILTASAASTPISP